MKLATIAGTFGTIAAGAVIVASAPATPSSRQAQRRRPCTRPG